MLRGTITASNAALVALVAASCAAPAREQAPTRTAAAAPAVLTIVDDDTGRALYEGKASYVWRKEERVAQLAGFGELVVGDAQGTDRCRLVDVRQGLGTLVVYERAPCGAVVAKDGRVCLAAGAFARKDGGPGTRTVGGCLDENDLLWRKVDDAAPPSVGPVQYHRICEAVPTKQRCELVYLRIDGLVVESNPDPMAGASLAYEEGDWRVCWLEAHRGAARITYTARTTCDAAEHTATIVRDDQASR